MMLISISQPMDFMESSYKIGWLASWFRLMADDPAMARQFVKEPARQSGAGWLGQARQARMQEITVGHRIVQGLVVIALVMTVQAVLYRLQRRNASVRDGWRYLTPGPMVWTGLVLGF